MSDEVHDKEHIARHYTHGNLLHAIELALQESGQTFDSVSPEQLSAIDEFHIGGREATAHLLNQAQFLATDQLLDIGCGLGGTTRYLASHYNNIVTGIDLTAEYIRVAQLLTTKLGMNNRINLVQASAVSLPFGNNTFGGITMLHVGMNIANKKQLFAEVYRCLANNSLFLLYDVMQTRNAAVIYPLPWAANSENSYLAKPEFYRQLLTDTGFEVVKITNRREFALSFFKQHATKVKASGVAPALSLQTLIQDNAKIKFIHLINQIKSGVLSPIEIVVKKLG